MTADPAAHLEIRACRFGDPDAGLLVAEVQDEYVLRYGGPDRTPLTHEDFDPPDGLFLVLYLDGEPVASGAIRRHDGTSAEIKRMYVRRPHRGRGFARTMLAELEDRAAAAGYARLVLETGGRQPEAVALYESSGYTEIERFGYYRDSPLNHCYAKVLPL